jgi:hypothetical protein
MVKDEPSLIISDYYDFHEKSSFFCNSLILCGSLEGNPLSPPEGEAACGGHPLDPLFFKEYFSTLSGVIALGGMPERRGRKHEMQRALKERLFVSMRVSTKPISAINTRLDALYASEDNTFRE